MSRSWIAIAGFMVLAGVLSGPAGAAERSPLPPSLGKLVLENFFEGKLHAEGTFHNTRNDSTRGIKVEMEGAWDGRVLTLVENFLYSDGERDKKTWRFTKVADGMYTGTREDVIGTADVRQDGEDVTLSYTARVSTQDGSSYNIHFYDRLRLVGPYTVLNVAKLKAFWFFDVGTVDLAISKGTGHGWNKRSRVPRAR